MSELKSKRRQTSRANFKSEKLVSEKRRQKLSLIFDGLDKDKFGRLQVPRTGEVKTNLPHVLNAAFAPLFKELHAL